MEGAVSDPLLTVANDSFLALQQSNSRRRASEPSTLMESGETFASGANVEQGFRLLWHRNKLDHARERTPTRVTLTSRRTAAFDGRLLAAARAWRQ